MRARSASGGYVLVELEIEAKEVLHGLEHVLVGEVVGEVGKRVRLGLDRPAGIAHLAFSLELRVEGERTVLLDEVGEVEQVVDDDLAAPEELDVAAHEKSLEFDAPLDAELPQAVDIELGNAGQLRGDRGDLDELGPVVEVLPLAVEGDEERDRVPVEPGGELVHLVVRVAVLVDVARRGAERRCQVARRVAGDEDSTLR